MNYAGVAKILKKHDKNTPFCTQERYLRKVVNPQSFAMCVGLKQGIQMVEECYRRLGTLKCSMDTENTTDIADIAVNVDGKHQREVEEVVLSSTSNKESNGGTIEPRYVDNMEKKKRTRMCVVCRPANVHAS